MNDHQKKMAYFLPNTFTALNMGCGFVSILFSINGLFYNACLCLILGAVFDSVDGRLARLTDTSSHFGEQFDSLSDLISFGMAPAIMFYQKFFYQLGRVGAVLTFIFLLCGALRLARFNANIEKVNSNFFQGLPIPASALALVGLCLLSLAFPQSDMYKIIAVPYIIFYALLMISNIPFPSFKESEWIKLHKQWALVVVLFLVLSVFFYEYIMVLVIISLYVVISLLSLLLNIMRKN